MIKCGWFISRIVGYLSAIFILSGCVSLKWHDSIDDNIGIGFERVSINKKGTYCGILNMDDRKYYHYMFEGMTEGHYLKLLVPAEKNATFQFNKEKNGLCNGQAASIRYTKDSTIDSSLFHSRALWQIEGEVQYGDEIIRTSVATLYPTMAIFQLTESAEGNNVLYLARKMDRSEYLKEFSVPNSSQRNMIIDNTTYIRTYDNWWQLYGPHYVSYDKYHYSYMLKNILFYSGLIVTIPIDIITFPIQLLSVIIDPKAIPTPH